MGDQAARDAVAALLALGRGHIHGMGIGGVGMAGLAYLLARRGYRVTGCDMGLNTLTRWLEDEGIPVHEGHSADHLQDTVDWIIRSAAVDPLSEEVRAAEAVGIPVFTRGEILPALLDNIRSIVVGGTHGKTTTSGFITQMLRACGEDPSWCVGGENARTGGVAGVGTGACTVVEADESDGTIALYRPAIGVVLNVDFDHMEHFESTDDFEDCFRQFAAQTREALVCNIDDSRAAEICRDAGSLHTFGFSAAAGVRATDLVAGTDGIAFTLCIDGRDEGRVMLPIHGEHNVLNALAALSVGHVLGLPVDAMIAACGTLALPRRRFECVAKKNGVTVVSDYAHHPTEIRALIRMARQQHAGRLCAVFQPHRYSRTKALGAMFPAAFDGVDELVLAPVYAASERPLVGGTTADLYRSFVEDAAAPRPLLAGSCEEAWQYLRRRLAPGDMLLVVGAGDVESIAVAASNEPALGSNGDSAWPANSETLRIETDVSLASKTSLGVGGRADVWAEVGTTRDLVSLWEWARAHGIPLRVMGGGSNLIVSDLGARGVVVRLAGPEFARIECDVQRVTVGAAVPHARLLKALAESGLGGLSFLEGIPGTMGGAVRMNAGAWGRAVCDAVLSIRCLNLSRGLCTLTKSDLSYGYRCCSSLENCIVLDVELAVEPASADEVREERQQITARREWMRGLRCAGSVFKNPEGGYAGRLIEDAGLKGLGVGGAQVSERHANVIVASADATASDVLALIDIVRQRVNASAGVMLETEVVVLGA